MTELLFRTDAYLQSSPARVVEIVGTTGAVVLDRTVFYAASGGQPGDAGHLISATGDEIAIRQASYDTDKATVLHLPTVAGPPALAVGDQLTARIDWTIRHRLMRMHTALHLLCALVKFPVTGGQIGADESRLDFDIPEAGAIDKEAIEADLNRLVAENHPISERWITDADLAANPGLVRTMSVKPPMGSGRVRLVAIGEAGSVDLQPCGGTHVRNTGEIGRLVITKIEKKGKQNRRLRLALA